MVVVFWMPGISSGRCGMTSLAARTARVPAAAALGSPTALLCSRSSTARTVANAARSSCVSLTVGSIDVSSSIGNGIGSSIARSGPSASMPRSADMALALPTTMRSDSESASRDIASVAATSSSTISSCAYVPSFENTTLSASIIMGFTTGPFGAAAAADTRTSAPPVPPLTDSSPNASWNVGPPPATPPPPDGTPPVVKAENADASCLTRATSRRCPLP
mmetsp:Transcript_39697/g.118120  ORF Transcript_39697/g.118120 Transcript_39697/m.118120 type:complete len:220 (+) Transcript_39697:624-1283(+)|eukprot:366226-Chlamydomonas_euryale.AAC.4